jgi:hypothetical protein
MLLQQFAGTCDGALHALLARRQVEARAIGQHQAAALNAHAVGHDEDQLVALDGGHHGEAHTRVAGGRLDDRSARLEQPLRLGGFDHRQRDAVLDGAAGIAAFGLDPDLGAREQAPQADMRRVADGVEDAGGFHRTGCTRP